MEQKEEWEELDSLEYCNMLIDKWVQSAALELWNGLKGDGITSISLRNIVWILYCNEEYEKDISELKGNDVSDERYQELLKFIKKENEYDKSGEDIEARYASYAFDNYYKECRKKLNAMFVALFGHTYDEAWSKTGNSYIIGLPLEAAFIEYLIFIEPLDVGKKIKKGKYEEIDEETVKEIMFYTEELCNSSNFLLKREVVLNSLKKKFKIIPEYCELKRSSEELYFYISDVILGREIEEDYYEAYAQIAEKIKECGEEITKIWIKSRGNYRGKHKKEIEACGRMIDEMIDDMKKNKT